MSLVIGSIALFVSLVALWMVSESMRKSHDMNDTFIKTYVRGVSMKVEKLAEALGESNKVLAQLKLRVEEMEGEIHYFKTAQANARKTLSDLEKSASGGPAPSSHSAHQPSHSVSAGKRDVA